MKDVEFPITETAGLLAAVDERERHPQVASMRRLAVERVRSFGYRR